MAQLAIKGHATRGKEVIKILEMLGGKNDNHCCGAFITRAYFINTNKYIESCDRMHILEYQQLSLEEFLEKFPYKVGDKVIVKGLSEYPKSIHFMKWFDDNIHYSFDDETWFLPSALQPYKEETMERKIESFEILESHCANEVKIEFDPSKFEIEERGDGYYVVKKTPKYPKTYIECCGIIVAKQDRHYFYTKKEKEYEYSNEIRILDQLDHLRMLLICRDAYWKLAGNWKPDWNISEVKFTIVECANGVVKSCDICNKHILAFPTAEMRDAFYENFKKLIETCKNFL